MALSMFDRFITNPTQLTGALSVAAATISCLIAALRSMSPNARTWGLLAFINFFFLTEIFGGFRFKIHDSLEAISKANDTYDQRGELQEPLDILLAIGAVVVISSIFLARRHAAGKGARVAASITTALVALFA